jgi:CRISPR/Cas system CSM-associated protein Csm5 (group 7 of RAMP superfamily)
MDLIGSHLNDNPFILQDLYINNKLYNLIDSLILSFKNKDLDVKYYREFWIRRKKEMNDSTVHEILKDIMFYTNPNAHLQNCH